MKSTLFILFLTLTLAVQAKWSVGYYPYPYSKVEFTTNPGYPVYGSIRFQTNSFISNLNTDLIFNWNFKQKEQIDFFTGAGIRYNLANFNSADANPHVGQFLLLGARIYPFEKVRPLGLSFDINPFLNSDGKSWRIESNLGLFWCFGR